MNDPIKDYFSILPSVLTLIPTHKCTAHCENCCFGCSPKINHFISVEKAKNYIDKAVKAFPSIELIVITGGECFLLNEDLTTIIRYATTKYSLLTRVVTNGYWASSYKNALERLQPLVEAGLSEINFSTGDEHQEFVKFDHIIYAIKASVKLGLVPLVSIETPPSGKFTTLDIIKNEELYALYKEKKLSLINASWMYFKENKEVPESIYKDIQPPRKPCENIFKGITINPHSQLLACCGLTVEYNPFLKLGSLEENDLKELYLNQFNDLFKIWLLVDGPKFIYTKIMEYRHLEPKFFTHDCAYCIELIRDKKNIQVLRKILPNEIPSILYRYKILIQGVEIKFQQKH